MSCIIKSKTTGTSVPLGLNSANLCVSINIGLTICSFAALNAGLKRSTCPTCPFTPCFSAKAINALASSMVVVIGFSINTCFPLVIAFCATSKCERVGVTISITSTASMSDSMELK